MSPPFIANPSSCTLLSLHLLLSAYINYFNSPLMWVFESCKIFPISHPLDHDGHETSDGPEDSKKQDHGQEPRGAQPIGLEARDPLGPGW